MFESSIEKVLIRRLEKGYIPDSEMGEKAVGGSFYIPDYQRGYRWDRMQVCQLLEDIWEYRDKIRAGSPYCLQPIVVKRKADSGQWIVIDGQQRLTTVYIILACLDYLAGREKTPVYEIDYQSKPEIRDCLNSLGLQADIGMDFSDIDNYHITNAYMAVRDWIRTADRGKKDEKTFATELAEQIIKDGVCVIWYEVFNDIPPEKIFTDINMGRIPLTNAELIKALLLKKDNFTEDEIIKENIRGAQARVSMSWDQMEKSLHKQEFWLFLTNDREKDVRTELVFDIMARNMLPDAESLTEYENQKITNENTYLFHIFSKELDQRIGRAQEKAKRTGGQYRYEEVLDDFWQEVDRYYQMLLDWYENQEWYHLIGFLVAAEKLDGRKADPGKMLHGLSRDYLRMSKTAFREMLRNRIIRSIMGRRGTPEEESSESLTLEEMKEDFGALRYDHGGEDKTRIHKILLLFNVATVRKGLDHYARFPFHEYKQTTWNLEHIHSVTTAVPETNKECRTWAEEVKKYLESVDYFRDDIREKVSGYLEEMTVFDKNDEKFIELYRIVTKAFSVKNLKEAEEETENGTDKENGIMNLALLDEKINKAYKNAIFPMKRKWIMNEIGEEHFVPVCTRNVFLKYYTGEVTQYYVWDENDRDCYFDRMCAMIHQYLTEQTAPGKETNPEDV